MNHHASPFLAYTLEKIKEKIVKTFQALFFGVTKKPLWALLLF